MNSYRNCIIFFITHKYILRIMILQTILHTSSVTSNHFDYHVSKKSDLPFIHYHGTPETKKEMEKKNAIDTYNLALLNDIDLMDGKNYDYYNDVDDQKHKKTHAHLRKSKIESFKKSHHKSPLKLSEIKDHKFDKYLKKKEKRSTLKKLHNNQYNNEELIKHKFKSMKKLSINGDDETRNDLKDESNGKLNKYQHDLTSKQSKIKPSNELHKKPSKKLMYKTINMTKKDSNKLNKKVIKITGFSLKNSNNSDIDLKKQPKLETYNNSDKSHYNLKNGYHKHRSSSKLDESLNDSTYIEHSNKIDKNLNNFNSKKQQQKTSSQSEKEQGNKFKKVSKLDKDHSGLKYKHTKKKLSNQVSESSTNESNGESDEELKNSIKNDVHSDASSKHDKNLKNNQTKQKLSNKIGESSSNESKDESSSESNEKLSSESDEELKNSIKNDVYSDASSKHDKNLKNKQTKQKLSNKMNETNKLNEDSSSGEPDDELNDSINNEHGNVSKNYADNLKTKHKKQKSNNYVGKSSTIKLKQKPSTESDKELNKSMHDELSDKSENDVNNLKNKHQPQKNNGNVSKKSSSKLKKGSEGKLEKNSKNSTNEKSSSELKSYSHKSRNRKPRKKLGTKEDKKTLKKIQIINKMVIHTTQQTRNEPMKPL